MQLSPEENAYVRARVASGEPVPMVLEYDKYPVSFYNSQEGQWQGIACDVLEDVEKLTGLSFLRVNDENT
ncbi:MAG: hypothetical protein LBT26_02755, partial [Clostridiales Family XIII bacterium]|nr:hypothetical protein [Clostridiales Family XIII bacterium]